jgi:hypothetical protein
MANKLKIAKTNGGLHDQYVSPTLVNGSHVGGTGGLTSQAGQQIQPQVFVTGGSSLPGSILAQKGSHKFKVTDGTLTGKCTLTNSPNLVAGQMNILINLSTVTANVAAANVAGGATSTYVTWTGTPTGPITTPRVGDYVIGFAGNAGVAQVTAINTASNVTIATSGNVAAQTSVSITDSTYVNRISNKFVSDYNGVKFRYHLATPDATFVQVQSA